VFLPTVDSRSRSCRRRLGITEEQLRRHLATAEAKIRNVFTPPTQTDIYEMFDRVP
jgi:hypothetical protein